MTRATCAACQFVLPLGVWMPRASRARAIPDKVVTPLRLMSFTMASRFWAFERALALFLARAAATVVDATGVPDFTPHAPAFRAPNLAICQLAKAS